MRSRLTLTPALYFGACGALAAAVFHSIFLFRAEDWFPIVLEWAKKDAVRSTWLVTTPVVAGLAFLLGFACVAVFGAIARRVTSRGALIALAAPLGLAYGVVGGASVGIVTGTIITPLFGTVIGAAIGAAIGAPCGSLMGLFLGIFHARAPNAPPSTAPGRGFGLQSPQR
jgi:hypothetical protein